MHCINISFILQKKNTCFYSNKKKNLQSDDLQFKYVFVFVYLILYTHIMYSFQPPPLFYTTQIYSQARTNFWLSFFLSLFYKKKVYKTSKKKRKNSLYTLSYFIIYLNNHNYIEILYII